VQWLTRPAAETSFHFRRPSLQTTPRHRIRIVFLDRTNGQAARRFTFARYVRQIHKFLATHRYSWRHEIRTRISLGSDEIHRQKLRALLVFVHVERAVTRAAPCLASAFRALTSIRVASVRVCNDLVLVFRFTRAFMNAIVSMTHAMAPTCRKRGKTRRIVIGTGDINGRGITREHIRAPRCLVRMRLGNGHRNGFASFDWIEQRGCINRFCAWNSAVRRALGTRRHCIQIRARTIPIFRCRKVRRIGL